MDEKTKKVLEIFAELSKIPRCSKNEEKISQWLRKWAEANGYEVKTDKVNNTLIKIPATQGYEAAPIVVIQGHMDMVCEKTKDSQHDFNKDAIELVYDGDWLKAKNTTLGADNGIAIALAFALVKDKSVSHPPLELLFTVDEETGLTGANALEKGFITGKILLNVDSEDEGEFTVGCAGGNNTRINLNLNYESIPSEYMTYKLLATKMSGGHSGGDIHLQKANANKILARALKQLHQKGDMRIVNINGGTAHNAIPRDAEAIIAFPADKSEEYKQIIIDFEKILKTEYATVEPELTLVLSSEQTQVKEVLAKFDTERVINLLLALPHGVAGMSYDMKDLVETSNNLATIRTKDKVLSILSSQRSSVASRLEEHTQRIEAMAKLAGADVKSGDGYPGWQPNMDSPLLAKCREVYRDVFGEEPVVKAIHAGLECGVIGDKYPGIDMISFGPTIKNPHSPDEKIYIPAIAKTWDFMVALLKSFK